MSKRPDEHGDRMKAYEAVYDDRIARGSIVYARIDGRGFSKFTRGMKKPFDEKMSDTMISTLRDIVDKTNAKLGYTQSDEFGLLFHQGEEDAQIFFDGRTQKLTSVLASLTTACFIKNWGDASKVPHFDCRICVVPSVDEAANMMLWRWKDCKKNAISMVAQAFFSHKELQGKDQSAMLWMLGGRNILMDSYPSYFKFGTYARKMTKRVKLTVEDLKRIPPKHRPTSEFVVRSVTETSQCSSMDTVKKTVYEALGEEYVSAMSPTFYEV